MFFETWSGGGMVYTTDLKSVAEWLESSSLSARTNLDRWASGLCQQTVNLPPNGIASSNLALSTNYVMVD